MQSFLTKQEVWLIGYSYVVKLMILSSYPNLQGRLVDILRVSRDIEFGFQFEVKFGFQFVVEFEFF